jgi:hypothetical protein
VTEEIERNLLLTRELEHTINKWRKEQQQDKLEIHQQIAETVDMIRQVSS